MDNAVKNRKSALPVIIVSVVAVLVIGILLFSGIKALNEKNDEILLKNRELTEKQQELDGKILELESKEKELEQKKDELLLCEEQKNTVIAERDKLVKAEEERLKAEADTGALDEAEKDAIDHMQAVLNRVNSIIDEMDSYDFDGSIESSGAQIELFCGSFLECRSEFEALKSVPKNFFAAGREYMDMSESYLYDARDLFVFLSGFQDTLNKLVEYGDSLKRINSPSELDLTSTDRIDAILTAIDETRCPSYFMPLWNRWKDGISLLRDFDQRVVEAVMANDSLRMYSALNLIQRITMLMNNMNVEMSEIIDDEVDFTNIQKEKARLIKEEIDSAAELEYPQRGSYSFENSFGGEVNLNYKTIDEIYPALYNSYNYFVFVEAGCLSGNRDIVVECEIPGLTEKFEQKYSLDTHTMPIYVRLSAKKNLSVWNNAWDSNIKVTIKDTDGTLIDTKSFPVHILSANDFRWNDDEFGVCTQDNILCFITPDSDSITKLKRDAIEVLNEVTDGEMNSFHGYQGPLYSEYVDTYLQAMALMIAMSNEGVRYNMDPFSINGADQHIMFPSQVIENKSGLCIETSLVIASALQSAGMHTYLVFPKNHAQVALEVWQGSGEYYLIETTRLPNEWEDYKEYLAMLYYGTYDNSSAGPISYLNSDEWEQYIKSEDVYLVDCSDGKMLGLTPFAF